jgi:hypothetical protein
MTVRIAVVHQKNTNVNNKLVARVRTTASKASKRHASVNATADTTNMCILKIQSS